MSCIGIIGCGNIAPVYGRTLRSIDGIDLVSVADGDPGRAERFAADHGVTAVSVEAMLGDDTIDAVVNLTPANAHAAVTTAILQAGKHAFSEKPLATTFAEGKALLDLAAFVDRRLGCAPDTFLGAGLQTARAAVDRGTIGEPLAVNAFMLGFGPEWWHPNPETFYGAGAGPLFDMGPYYLTTLVHLLGPARSVSASARIGEVDRVMHSKGRVGDVVRASVPTHVASTINFVSGAIATLVTSFDVKATRYRNIEVYGTDATLAVPDPNTFGGPVAMRSVIAAEWRDVPLIATSGPQQRGIGLADMLAAIDEGRPHRASAEVALHVLELMTGAIESAETGRRVELTTTCERPARLGR